MARKPTIADVLGFGGVPKRDLTQGFRREISKIKPGQKLRGSISRARPTASQELGQLLTPNTRFGNELAAKIAGAVDYSPLSVLTGFVDARRAYNAGNLGSAASTGLLAAIGATPGGKGVKYTEREIADIVSKFSRPSVEPAVTQAGRAGIPLSGKSIFSAQHTGPSPFISVKTAVRPEDVPFTTTPLGALPTGKTVDPQSLKNAMLVSLYGDKTDALKAVTKFAGADVNVPLNAGPKFAAAQQALGGKAAWASEATPVNLLRQRIAEGLEQGRDVYGITTTMGPSAGDQTVDMVNLMVQAARQSKIKRADIAKFDKKMREIAPGFPGLMDEDAMRFLEAQTQGRRKKMIDLLETSGMQGAGFPNVGAGRIAITDPNLLYTPAGATGYSLVKFGPETLLDINPLIPHPSYNTQMAGEYIGQLPELVPFDLVFKDMFKQRRAQGLNAGSDLRALELKKPNQVVDQETIDGLMSYIERLRP